MTFSSSAITRTSPAGRRRRHAPPPRQLTYSVADRRNGGYCLRQAQQQPTPGIFVSSCTNPEAHRSTPEAARSARTVEHAAVTQVPDSVLTEASEPHVELQSQPPTASESLVRPEPRPLILRDTNIDQPRVRASPQSFREQLNRTAILDAYPSPKQLDRNVVAAYLLHLKL